MTTNDNANAPKPGELPEPPKPPKPAAEVTPITGETLPAGATPMPGVTPDATVVPVAAVPVAAGMAPLPAEDAGVSEPAPFPATRPAQSAAEAVRSASANIQQTVHDLSDSVRDKSAEFVEKQYRQVDRDPMTGVLKALALGLAIGLVVRLLQGSSAAAQKKKQQEIDIAHRPTLKETKYHLGSVLLPFLWPLFHRARSGYERSAEALHEAADHVKSSDLRKMGRKSVKKVEDWFDDEVVPVVKKSRKKIKKLIS